MALIDKTLKEEWLPIKGYSDWYSVSNTGKVMSFYPYHNGQIRDIKPLKVGRLLLQGSDKNGYKLVRLYLNGRARTFKVHRLVAIAFIGEQPSKKINQINHIDSDTSNNLVTNLEWTSPKKNVRHAIKHGGRKIMSCETHPRAKLKNKDVLEILKSEKPAKELFKEHNVSYSTIMSIRAGKTFKQIYKNFLEGAT
jgi:hypothetical protein